jgi:phospholipid/cholesterol/gamma-HCH transport system ATP-binding protein
MDPEYVLYDEPTTGLDPITADVINQLIREMQKRLHVTSVVVTHDIKSAYTVADRIVLLYQGRVMFDGTAEETRHTDDAMMRQFIEGSSRGPIQPV